jgi:hypothetical protein
MRLELRDLVFTHLMVRLHFHGAPRGEFICKGLAAVRSALTGRTDSLKLSQDSVRERGPHPWAILYSSLREEVQRSGRCGGEPIP